DEGASLLKSRFGVHGSSSRGSPPACRRRGGAADDSRDYALDGERPYTLSTVAGCPTAIGDVPSVSASGLSLCGTQIGAVVRGTNLRNDYDAASVGPGHLARDGRIFVEGKMSPRPQIIGYESNEVATQTAFGEDDHVIEAFASDRADHAFDVG